VRLRDRVYGNLYLTEKRGANAFTEEDELAVITLAAQAAVAIENARLHEEVQRLAILEDRERIAKELHDGVVQALFSVGMALQGAEGLVEDPEAVRKRLDQSVGAIDDVIRDLRNYIFGLGPGNVADRQLDRALQDMVDEFRRGSDVAIRLEVDPRAASAVAPRAADIVQVVREALSNAVRHGEPQTLSIVLSQQDGGVVLEIEDDGKGFDPTDIRGGGRGLSNIRQRAEAAGGELEITSSKGVGTRLTLLFPR
jgi:signal transduction histidine kinase